MIQRWQNRWSFSALIPEGTIPISAREMDLPAHYKLMQRIRLISLLCFRKTNPFVKSIWKSIRFQFLTLSFFSSKRENFFCHHSHLLLFIHYKNQCTTSYHFWVGKGRIFYPAFQLFGVPLLESIEWCKVKGREKQKSYHNTAARSENEVLRGLQSADLWGWPLRSMCADKESSHFSHREKLYAAEYQDMLLLY